MPATAKHSTRAFLHAHGLQISPKDLDLLVAEAISRLRRDLFRADPKRDLTEEEVRVLEAGGFDLEPQDPGRNDPLARTAALYAGLLGTSYDTAGAARLLGVDASRVRHRLTARPPSLYGIRLESGWRIPRFQFHRDELLPGISEVVAELDRELHPVAVYSWFTASNPDLTAGELTADPDQPLSPRDWLRCGFPPAAIVDLAKNL